MIIVGIDPGANGALTVISKDTLTTLDFKSSGIQAYSKLLKSYKPDIVIVEKVHAMPKQGVKSMFSFGQRLGEIEGMLISLEIPYELVTPQIWIKALNIPAKAGKKVIASSIRKMYPSAQLYGSKGGLLDGRADSLGLAHYGKVKYIKEYNGTSN